MFLTLNHICPNTVDDIFLNSSLVTPQNKAFKALLLKFATLIVAHPNPSALPLA